MSLAEVLTVYTSSPNGGVSKPASIAIIPIIAKAKGSIPNDTAIGSNIATVRSIMDILSIIIPRINQTSIIKNTIPIKPKPVDKNISFIVLVTPVMARDLEYKDAARRSNNIGAEVLPTDNIVSIIYIY